MNTRHSTFDFLQMFIARDCIGVKAHHSVSIINKEIFFALGINRRTESAAGHVAGRQWGSNIESGDRLSGHF
ncbi:hypothetical protein [Dickeya chrysanthemi]|uniref:hypothetical protein n=1 Tax=Dickeya chrysanthemi TaxID=556 RepID=UPI000587394B|nr:hypothetical protein [Dickeya chrysanthemi]